MQKLIRPIIFGLVLGAALFSCVPNKKVIYMQELEESMGPLVESSDRYGYQTEDYLLQVNDIVEVSIKTTDPELNKVFNVVVAENNNMAQMGGSQGAGDAFFMNGYTLDDQGMVEIPLVGELKFLGLTTREAKELVESKVVKYVKEDEYFVRVRLGGVRFSALGEFNQSGKYTILQNRVTIFEAIAFAGDLSRLAKRDEVLLVRQYPDGSQIHKINLLDRELLGSEYYFLKPNDMIYAEPMKVREIGAGNTLVETLTLFTTTVTAIALILTLIQNN
ncbi:polysaccharide biosynthesis/export family protein [uncultured Algoriphagus sp.]|uniref:polysaccharide biosynthesis/export family protein n=1 Tax=Algoriphagus formosus TaxID=2007308 RepID=UPI00258BDEA1|nr:polysaccharide biosynthesis/export family protein [uncultured Algoriphagus sp.]